MPDRPSWIQDDMLEFLDDLRDSAVTNMYAARPYIMDEYYMLSKQEASELLRYWQKTFAARHEFI
ncbi:hypothetical protein LCGC14_1729730 [marine sediment metagenome]|uniref:Uncharacterized protein n=1 Tax=marine sediment metagenome TaxID=412755 RepID=A0A0F9HXR0_9ZZZZ